ncbi:MAG: hypothetical protein HFJ24_07450 [Clostridia bacterium]|nr:hypothetical protein [Clostridia bacterium]MCI9275750.1 hypothetical protein [Clostridia bacterium]
MKKKFILAILIFLIISIFILAKFEYKKLFSGNNISKSDNTDILNISSYEATIEVEVYSNKNTNKYLIKQKYVEPNIFRQEIINPTSIEGITIISNGEQTILENKAYNLKTVYENFKGKASNLSLVSFINAYKEDEGSKIEENEKEKIMKTKIKDSNNKYQKYQNLYISKKTNLPTKMEILDINQNRTVYILYNEIVINKTNPRDIL